MNFDQLFDDFSKVKVAVVGDVMLDTYWWGHVDRISPEAPVPVVALDSSELRIGGAGNFEKAGSFLGFGFDGDDPTEPLTEIGSTLNLLQSKGLARVLAQPKLVTKSGSKAKPLMRCRPTSVET